MPSIVYDSTVDDMAKGNIAFGLDAFRVLLVTNAYVADKAAHTKRSNITGEVIGTGYTAGGESVAVSVSTDLVENRTDIALDGAAWAGSTITAAGAVYYKDRGGLPEADELVAFIDFAGDVMSIAPGAFTLEASTVRIQN